MVKISGHLSGNPNCKLQWSQTQFLERQCPAEYSFIQVSVRRTADCLGQRKCHSGQLIQLSLARLCQCCITKENSIQYWQKFCFPFLTSVLVPSQGPLHCTDTCQSGVNHKHSYDISSWEPGAEPKSTSQNLSNV